jgi:hypothetical protein
MNQDDLTELLSEAHFSPFIITMTDGFSFAVGPEERKHMLVGKRLLVTMDSEGNFIHLPYRSIARIQEPNGNKAP